MKINYKNPKTGKPSTVVISDMWVDIFLQIRGLDCFTPAQQMRSLVEHLADYYFMGGTEFVDFHDDPDIVTFTKFCEKYLATCISAYVTCAISREQPDLFEEPPSS